MLFTYNRNDKGPQMDPYGTPQLMLATLEYYFSYWLEIFNAIDWTENSTKGIFFNKIS